jgi:DNA-binding ferritin-like protein
MKQELNQEMRDKVIEFVNFIMGAVVKNQEIHWVTNNSRTHNETDNLKWNLLDFVDSIAEQYIGAVGRGVIGSGGINATILSASTWDELTDEIKERTVAFKEYLNGQKSIYGGMVSRIDDFIGHVLVNIYREEMD